jgi:hypothetical protein
MNRRDLALILQLQEGTMERNEQDFKKAERNARRKLGFFIRNGISVGEPSAFCDKSFVGNTAPMGCLSILRLGTRFCDPWLSGLWAVRTYLSTAARKGCSRLETTCRQLAADSRWLNRRPAMAQPLSHDSCSAGIRWRCSPGFALAARLRSDLLYTLIWSTGFALALSLLGIIFTQKLNAQSVWANWIVSTCIGYVIHLEYLVGRRLLGKRIRSAHPWMRVSYNSIVPISGVFFGYLLGLKLLNVNLERYFSDSSAVLGVALTSLLVASVLSFIYLARPGDAYQGKIRA